MFTDTYGSDLSGVLPLQHRKYNAPQDGHGPWDLDLRAHKRCVRITGRWDIDGGIGYWEYDPESVGDLCGGFCWKSVGPDQRQIAYWSFAIPAMIQQGPVGGTPTPGVAKQTEAVKAGQMLMLPQGDRRGTPDGRLRAIPVIPKRMVGEGPKKAKQAPIGGQEGVLHLGIGSRLVGWSYPDTPGYAGALQVGIGAKAPGWQRPQYNPSSQLPSTRYANPMVGVRYAR